MSIRYLGREAGKAYAAESADSVLIRLEPGTYAPGISRTRSEIQAPASAAMFAATRSSVRRYASVGLNSTISVPAVTTGTWPGSA